MVYDYYVLSLRTFPPFQVVVHVRNSYPEVFCRKDVPRSFAKIHRKTPVPESFFNPIQDGLFRGCSRMGGGQKGPLPKICHTYPTMMKLGTIIPYPKKIQKIYESRDTPP